MKRSPALSSLLLFSSLCTAAVLPAQRDWRAQATFSARPAKDAKVLILGGGMAGITAARTLHDKGISDFIVVEARDELGGRMMSHRFGAPGRKYTVELGANWVQGTQTGDGPENPIWTLAKRHDLRTQRSSYFDGLTTYDETGEFDFLHVFERSVENFERLIATAGERVPKGLVDTSARTGYSLIGAQPQTHYDMAAEYFQFDWEFTCTPEESSWIAASLNNNSTFAGFSEDNFMSIDARGFKLLVQHEARTFLRPEQLRLNARVTDVHYGVEGVQVTLDDGRSFIADYIICTFSIGVLQHGDVQFHPQLPQWKREAIHSMTMGVYTKLFLQFPHKFWFDTEEAIYADRERGRYPIWQSLDHPRFLPGSGILIGTVTGAFSRRIEALPVVQVKAEVMAVLSTMFPNITIPEPLDFHFHRWSIDPLYRGSYANWPPSFLPEHHTNLRADLDGTVWFAGEATSKLFFGYLQAAYFEGQDIGGRVAECVLGGGCLGLEHIEQVKNASPYDVS